jgi:hypothetical protein
LKAARSFDVDRWIADRTVSGDLGLLSRRLRQDKLFPYGNCRLEPVKTVGSIPISE